MSKSSSKRQHPSHLHIWHDKRHNLIFHTLSDETQASASCHGEIPDAFIPVLARLLLGELIQQHAHQWLQCLPYEVVIDSLLAILYSLHSIKPCKDRKPAASSK